MPPTTAVLAVNLGSPASPNPNDVRAYLAEFLSDPHVIDIPAPLRWLLLHGIILRTRPARSAAAYAKIWSPDGSPLVVHTRRFSEGLRRQLGDRALVGMAMRYGQPAIRGVLARWLDEDIRRLVLFPCYPQFAGATTRTSIEAVKRAMVALGVANKWELKLVHPYYDHPAFVDALAAVYRAAAPPEAVDHAVFSFHGLPERHLRKEKHAPRACGLPGYPCCAGVHEGNARCYRAQCAATARGLAASLGLPEDGWTLSFQSRLGRDKWIGPATAEVLEELPRRGVRKVAVACPSFTADCLETLEEIGMAGRERFLGSGGSQYSAIPCLNDSPSWVRGAERILTQRGLLG